MAGLGAPPPLLTVALYGKCPRCGRGRLYQGLLTVVSTCPVCGLDMHGEDAGDGAAVFVILILGALVTVAGVAVDNSFSPPLWVHALIWVPTTIVAAVWLLRVLKAALIAQQYRVTGFSDKDGQK